MTRPATDTPPSTAATTERETSTGTRRFWHDLRTPSFLLSFICHTSLLILLALLSVTGRVGIPRSFDFDATISNDVSDSVQTELEVVINGDEAPPAVVESAEPSQPSTSVAPAQIAHLLELQPTTATSQSSAKIVQQLQQATQEMVSVSLAATGVEGRAPTRRREVALARGGTLDSEAAVERALEWLAAHQLPNGSWSLVHSAGPCQGRCKNDGSKERFQPAATGLALLAFLGAGYTHKAGKYQREVNSGVYYLLQIMEEANDTGSFLHQSESGMYNHGIAAFALCEAYQLSGDADLKRPAQLAINFIASAQGYTGGWGYLPKQPGDLTISGWQMMALKSAHAAGLDVSPAVIVRIDNFLNSKQTPNEIYYGYGKPDREPTCSSIGMMLRMFRGRPPSDTRVLELAQFLVKKGPSNTDCYFNYYATLFLFHVGDQPWRTWNPKVRDYLIRTQSQTDHEAGSWYFDNAYSEVGGRLYTTAMCAMTLEVYYRFAPLYMQSDKPFQL